MASFVRRVTPYVFSVLAFGVSIACSSDDGDDDESGGGGSAGASNGGSGGSSGDCATPCDEGDFCSQCFNPDNPDEPRYACIAVGTSC